MPASYRETSPDDLDRRIQKAKEILGERLLILGHHYQMDEVMKFADVDGDSFGLSRTAGSRPGPAVAAAAAAAAAARPGRLRRLGS